jgi:predicted lipid carrier protein YhbT
MASAEECREALQTLSGRLGEMNPRDRSSFFSNRTFSCHVTDLGVTFVTRITDQGAEPVKEAAPDEPPADIRLTANSDDVLALAATPANIARMWLSGRVKVQASMRDLLALRRLL